MRSEIALQLALAVLVTSAGPSRALPLPARQIERARFEAPAPPSAASEGEGKAAPNDASLEREIARAKKLLENRDTRGALSAFSKLARSHPSCVPCLIGVAAANSRLGAFPAAERAARQALEANDDPTAQAIAYSTLGVSFYDRTPYGASAKLLEANMIQAEAAFRRAYELDGGRTEAIRWNLASALEWLGSREADFLFSDPEALHDEDATSASDDAILVAGEVQAPVKLSDAPVEYTDRARYQRVEGVVVLQTIINTAGDVTRVKVMKGLPGCTMQAIRSVRQWKFKPATLHGEPVPVYFNLTVNFQLQR